MPPKSAHGRKKAISKEIVQNGSESEMKSEEVITNGQDLNSEHFNKLSKDKAHNDMPTEDKNLNGNGHLQNLIETEEISDNTSAMNCLVKDKWKETENEKEISDSNSEHLVKKNDINLNSEVVPLKHGKKKANVSPENIGVQTETVDVVPDVDEVSKESLAKQSLKVTTTESSKSNTPDEKEFDVPKNNDKTKPDTQVDISDNENKHEDKKVPLKRGRPKRVREETSDKQLQPEKKIHSKRGQKTEDVEEPSKQISGEQLVTEDIVPSKRGRKRPNIPLYSEKSPDLDNIKKSGKEKPTEEIPGEQLQTEKKVPSKRGQKNADIPLKSSDLDNLKKTGNEKPSEEIPDEQLQTEEKVPSKRGRKKAVIPLKSEKSSDLEDIKETVNEEPFEKVPSKRGRKKANIPLESKKSPDLENIEEIPDEQLQTEDKVPAMRGRKKANIPLKSDNFKEEVKEEESGSVTKEQNMPAKRGRGKATKQETVEGLNNKESNVDFKEPSQDINNKESSENNTKSVMKNKNARGAKKQKPSLQAKELISTGRKRKNEISAEDIEKNKQDFNVTKVLKVALQRSANIDKMCEEQTKITETGGAKNTKAGDKRPKGDVDSKNSGEKSPKKPKAGSKGQSKKDKMPDVTLLDFGNNSTSPSGKPWNLKISSWNVNGVRAWLEKDGLAYITHENPDVVAFQETKCSDKMLPKEVNIEGYHSYWLAGDKDGYSGVGLLSKKEPVSVNYGIGVEEHDNEGRVITAEYETFYLVAAYVPNSGRGLVRLSYRMEFDKDFRSYIKNLEEKKPVVLCGDLNVAHEEIDLANPKSNKRNAGFTVEEREGFSTLLSKGFIDSFRHLYPDKKGAYTFWTYMMNSRAKNVGWRLDYFVLSKKLTDHLCDNVIRKDVFGSDHCPITLFLCI